VETSLIPKHQAFRTVQNTVDSEKRDRDDVYESSGRESELGKPQKKRVKEEVEAAV